MSESRELSPFNEQDFLAIEAAVLETEKGRWFLNEFAQRNRVADTQTLLNALSRLERNLTAQPVQLYEDNSDVEALARAIEATCSDIAAVRNDMLDDKAEIPADIPIFTHLTQSAHKIAADLISTAEALQSTIAILRSDDTVGEHADRMDSHVHSLFDGGWRQDVLAQRIAKAMGLLEHLDQNLKAMGPGTQPADETTNNTAPIGLNLSPDNLRYFSADEELFSAQETGTQQSAPQIKVISRTPQPQQPTEDPVDTDAGTAAPQSADIDGRSDDDAKDIVFVSADEASDDSVESSAQVSNERQPASPDTNVHPEPSPQTGKPRVIVVRKGRAAETAPAEHAVDPAAASVDGEIQPSPDTPFAAPDASMSTANVDAPQPAAMQAEAGMQASASDAVFAVSGSTQPPEEQPPAASEEITTEPETEPAPPEATRDAAATTTDGNDRIVVIRRTSSAEAEIPFADYLGVDTGDQPARPAADAATPSNN